MAAPCLQHIAVRENTIKESTDFPFNLKRAVEEEGSTGATRKFVVADGKF